MTLESLLGKGYSVMDNLFSKSSHSKVSYSLKD